MNGKRSSAISDKVPGSPTLRLDEVTRGLERKTCSPDGSRPTLASAFCDNERAFISSKQQNGPHPVQLEIRKTPFGTIRLCSGVVAGGDGSRLREGEGRTGNERVTSSLPPSSEIAHHSEWGGGYGTSGLCPVRRRLASGVKVAIERDGRVSIHAAAREAAYAISADGRRVFVFNASGQGTIVDILAKEAATPLIDSVYRTAAAWLMRRRRRMVLATFTCPLHEHVDVLMPNERSAHSRLAANGTVECRVRSNGPRPDYVIFIRATIGDLRPEECGKYRDGHTHVLTLAARVEVRRCDKFARAHTNVESFHKDTRKPHGLHRTRQQTSSTIAAIEAKDLMKNTVTHTFRWHIVEAPPPSLTKHWTQPSPLEDGAIRVALSFANRVDAIFNALLTSQQFQ